jgi:hypothetical protein
VNNRARAKWLPGVGGLFLDRLWDRLTSISISIMSHIALWSIGKHPLNGKNDRGRGVALLCGVCCGMGYQRCQPMRPKRSSLP